MKSTELKKLIKEAVKEAIGEEMRDILLEAVKTPRQAVTEHQIPSVDTSHQESNLQETRSRYADVLNGMVNENSRTISMNSSHAQGYAPQPATNTTAQGSALPPGEVNMDQIMGFISKR